MVAAIDPGVSLLERGIRLAAQLLEGFGSLDSMLFGKYESLLQCDDLVPHGVHLSGHGWGK